VAQFALRAGIHVLSRFGEHVTHVVMTSVELTEKMLRALVLGSFITGLMQPGRFLIVFTTTPPCTVRCALSRHTHRVGGLVTSHC